MMVAVVALLAFRRLSAAKGTIHMLSQSSDDVIVQDARETTCCVVGGGPAGVMLSLLLARRGVPVTLLEAHKDFERDFRGDTIHPSTLDILHQLGLAERLLEIPHGEMRSLKIVTRQGSVVLGDLGRLRCRYPFVAMLPQAQFLEFLIHEAEKLASFARVMGANVQRLVEENGVIRGVRYRGADDHWHEVRAILTVAADGRFSKIRSLVGFEPNRTAPPMDVLWFRLPRLPTDNPDQGTFYIHGGHLVVVLERAEEWQVGYVIFKGSFQQVRAAGLDALKTSLRDIVPWLGDRVDHLTDWKHVNILSVESSRLPCWHKSGLLLIGDAAHVMSPVMGVGINYAIQDAVEAANLLAEPLRQGHVDESALAAVQKRRQFPVRFIQAFQRVVQNRIAAPALKADQPFRFPWYVRLMLRLPWLRNFPARMVAYGIRPARVK